MNVECGEFDKRLEAWLEQSWDEEDGVPPAQLTGHADGCPRCYRRLATARRLLGFSHEPPEHLERTVLDRLEQGGRRRQTGLGLSVAVAATVVAVLAFGYFLGVHRGSRQVSVQLTLNAPEASSVSVIGDWNGWDPEADPLSDSDNDGVWEIELKLPSGEEHMYQFVIDRSTRKPDPLAAIKVDDGFGGVNSVLEL